MWILKNQIQYLGFIISKDVMGDLKVSLVCRVISKDLFQIFQKSQYPSWNWQKFVEFKWTKECQALVEYHKENLTAVPVLDYLDTRKPYIFYADASKICIGTYFCQVHSDASGTQPELPSKNLCVSYLINWQHH